MIDTVLMIVVIGAMLIALAVDLAAALGWVKRTAGKWRQNS